MENKMVDIIKNNKRWCLLFICLIIFIAILEDVFDNEIVVFDTIIYNTISLVKTSLATNIFKTITVFGSAKVLVGITLVSFIILRNKRIPTCIALNLVTIGALNQVLKLIIQRPRPEGFRLIEETGYSFPSGHSMASMAFYGLIIYFIFKYVKNRKLKIAICTMLALLIVSIGISRIYLGVHYASDVIAGFVISIAYLVVYITIVVKTMGIMKNEL